MNPEYFLSPFDVAHIGHALPHADFIGEWRGEQFLCRLCNGILHFRSVEQSSSSATFAVVPPLSQDLEEAHDLWPLLWEEAMKNENIARFINFQFRGSFDRDFPFYLGFDGNGWMREIWNRDDCHFTGGFSPAIAQFGNETDLLDSVETIFHETVLPWLEEQTVPQPLDDAEVEWLCGSLEELSHVVRVICALVPAMRRRDVSLFFCAETMFERALLWSAGGIFSRHWQNGSWGAPVMRDPQIKLPTGFWTLIDLALDYNTPSGLYWEYHDSGMGRTAYSPHSSCFQLQIPTPSNHERVEAPLFLKSWLQGKLPASQIDELLNS